jgi:hypothetical protein
LLRDKSEVSLHSALAGALGAAGQGEGRVTEALLAMTVDGGLALQIESGKALGQAGQGDEKVADELLRILLDTTLHPHPRIGAASGLGDIGVRQSEAIEGLLSIVLDDNESDGMRAWAGRF